MKKSLVIVFATLAFVGLGRAVDLSGVPCPSGGTPGPRDDEYVLDDGTGEESIGLIGGGTLILLNQFWVLPGYERIGEVSVAWGQIAAGRPGEILIFDDPNNDGNPQDVTAADLLGWMAVTSEGGNDDTFHHYPVGASVGEAGDAFFVGVCCSHFDGEYPARLDRASPMLRSWAGGDSVQGYECADPNGGSLGLDLIDVYGYPGSWMIRASGCVVMPGMSGACCLADGSCVYTTAVDCSDFLHGLWEPCASCIECPDLEACCLPDGSCQMLWAFRCEDQGGQVQGEGSQCDPNPCTPVSVDKANWGRIRLLFRYQSLTRPVSRCTKSDAG